MGAPAAGLAAGGAAGARRALRRESPAPGDGRRETEGCLAGAPEGGHGELRGHMGVAGGPESGLGMPCLRDSVSPAAHPSLI